jgi:hypothetical protein
MCEDIAASFPGKDKEPAVRALIWLIMKALAHAEWMERPHLTNVLQDVNQWSETKI